MRSHDLRCLRLMILAAAAGLGCSESSSSMGTGGGAGATGKAVSGGAPSGAGGSAGSDTGGSAGSDAGGSAGSDTGGSAGSDAGGSSGDESNAGSASWDGCNAVRLTTYPAGDVAWCAFDRRAPMLPEFVRQGLTIAIPEPWNGSSHAGDPGEACGECWEITTLAGTRTVMVHDLCPIQGNPLCMGSVFDFDVSLETGAALGLTGLEEGRTRRVACPLTGNAFLSVLGRDEWGTLRFQVINHRLPVRSIEYRAAGDTVYYAAHRSAAAWSISNDHRAMFNKDGPGGNFRLTSAVGEVVDMPNILTYDVEVGSYFDLGAQLAGELPQSGASCEFLPPAGVYVDGYGGIESAGWVMNPWGSASPTEVSSDCVSGSCLRVEGMSSGTGFHIFYRQPFNPRLYKALRFSVRSESGAGQFNALLTSDNSPSCEVTTLAVSDTWTEVSIDTASICVGVDLIRNVTFHGVTPLTLWFDDIRFEN